MEDDDEFPPPPPGSANRGNGSDMGSDEEDDVEFLNCDDSLTTDGSRFISRFSGFSSKSGVPGRLPLPLPPSSFSCGGSAGVESDFWLLNDDGLCELLAESFDDDLFVLRVLCCCCCCSIRLSRSVVLMVSCPRCLPEPELAIIRLCTASSTSSPFFGRSFSSPELTGEVLSPYPPLLLLLPNLPSSRFLCCLLRFSDSLRSVLWPSLM